MPNSPTATLIATLGGQPQIITFALDALLADGVPIQRLLLIYLDNGSTRLEKARSVLNHELTSAYPTLVVEWYPITIWNRFLLEITNDIEANQTSRFINRLIATERESNAQLHVCITGGLRLLSFIMVEVAMLHLHHTDRLWDMYTAPDLLDKVRDGKQMHNAHPEKFSLIEVPVLKLGQRFAGFSQGIHQAQRLIDEEELQRCEHVFQSLSPAQRRVLIAFARGLEKLEVSELLNISEKTVSSHLEVIYDQCERVWQAKAPKNFHYWYLYGKFRPFLNRYPEYDQIEID